MKGSDKQLPWAQQIRDSIAFALEAVTDEGTPMLSDEKRSAVWSAIYAWMSQRNFDPEYAGSWIDLREYLLGAGASTLTREEAVRRYGDLEQVRAKHLRGSVTGRHDWRSIAGYQRHLLAHIQKLTGERS